MNPCALTDRLDAYLDGELAPGEARRFEAHAEACPACAAELTLARRIETALHTLPAEPCPYDVFQSTLDRIGREARDRPALPASAVSSKRARLPRWQIAGVAAVLALLVALGLLMGPDATTPSDAPIAETEQPTPVPLPDEPLPATQQITEDTLAAPVPAVPEARPAPEQPARERRAQPRRRTAPPAPQAAPADDVAEAAPSPEAEPTEADAEAAREGVRLAFALFADANRKATEAVRTNVGNGLAHVSDVLPILR